MDVIVDVGDLSVRNDERNVLLAISNDKGTLLLEKTEPIPV